MTLYEMMNRSALEWSHDTYLPDEFPFFFHGKENELTPLDEDMEKEYNMLLVWWLVQDFRKYVIDKPLAPQGMYDCVLRRIQMFQDEETIPTQIWPVQVNISSGLNPCRDAYRYPEFIRVIFSKENGYDWSVGHKRFLRELKEFEEKAMPELTKRKEAKAKQEPKFRVSKDRPASSMMFKQKSQD